MMIRALRSLSLASQAPRFQSARKDEPPHIQKVFQIGNDLLRQLTGAKDDVAAYKAFAQMSDKERQEMYALLDRELPKRVRQALSPEENIIVPSTLLQQSPFLRM